MLAVNNSKAKRIKGQEKPGGGGTGGNKRPGEKGYCILVRVMSTPDRRSPVHEGLLSRYLQM